MTVHKSNSLNRGKEFGGKDVHEEEKWQEGILVSIGDRMEIRANLI